MSVGKGKARSGKSGNGNKARAPDAPPDAWNSASFA